MKRTKRILLILISLLPVFAAMTYLGATWGEREMTDIIWDELPGKRVELSAGKIYYRWHGPENGPVVVMVHGFSTPQFVFDNNIPALTGAGFRVLTFDHFGRGYSDRPKSLYDENFFDRELTELFDALKIEKPVTLLGYSLGGGIATVFTARHPEKVMKLVLAAPVGFMKKVSGVNRLLMVPVLGEYLFALVGKKSLINTMKEEVKKGLATQKMVTLFKRQFEYKGAWQAMLSTMRHYPMHGLKSYYEAVGKEKMPLLILWGTADESVSFSGSEKARAAISRAKVKAFEGVPHALVYSHAEQVNRELLSFLK